MVEEETMKLAEGEEKEAAMKLVVEEVEKEAMEQIKEGEGVATMQILSLWLGEAPWGGGRAKETEGGGKVGQRWISPSSSS